MAKNLKPTTNDTIIKQFPEDPRAKRRLKEKPRRLSFGFSKFGYIQEDGGHIPPEYLVKVTSYRNNCTIIAPLQEDIKLDVKSYWEPIIPTAVLRTANIFIQAAAGGKRSAITSSTTRRLWQGTSPMSISLPLKFEAVYDPYVEVVEPCRLLQTMAAPSDPVTDRKPVDVGAIIAENIVYPSLSSIKKIISNFPALVPPGPSPFVWKDLLNGQTNYPDEKRSDIEESERGGDFIMVEFGTFLTFWNVIITSGGVKFKNKFNSEGYPISAEAEIIFETYEMPTKESLEYSYTKVVS